MGSFKRGNYATAVYNTPRQVSMGPPVTGPALQNLILPFRLDQLRVAICPPMFCDTVCGLGLQVTEGYESTSS